MPGAGSVFSTAKGILRNGVGDLVGLCGWQAARVGRGCRLSLFIPSDSALPHPFLHPLYSWVGTGPTHLLLPCPPTRAGCLSLRGDGRGGQASAPQVGLAPAQPPSSWEESGPLASAGDRGGGGAGRGQQPSVFSDPCSALRGWKVFEDQALGRPQGLCPGSFLGSIMGPPEMPGACRLWEQTDWGAAVQDLPCSPSPPAPGPLSLWVPPPMRQRGTVFGTGCPNSWTPAW